MSLSSEVLWHLRNDVSPPTKIAALARWTGMRGGDYLMIWRTLKELEKQGLAKRIPYRGWTATTFEDWKKRCQEHANKHGAGLPSNLWDEDDPYDLKEAADDAFKKAQPFYDFVDEMFAEDLARAAYDEHLWAESLMEGGDDGSEDA